MYLVLHLSRRTRCELVRGTEAVDQAKQQCSYWTIHTYLRYCVCTCSMLPPGYIPYLYLYTDNPTAHNTLTQNTLTPEVVGT